MVGRALRFTLWTASVLAVAGYARLAWCALRAGGPPSPLEAAVLEHAVRMASAQPIFRDPGGGSPVALMPLFSFVVSGLVRMFDPHPWEPRLVTVLAALAAAAIVAVVVQRETRHATLGVASGALLLVGQGFTAGMANGPESLSLLLVLAGCLALRYASGIAGGMLAAFPMAAACFTHPAGLWFAIAALFHLAEHDRRRLAVFAASLALLVGFVHAGLSVQLGPWFNFYAWDISLRALQLDPIALVGYLGRQLLGIWGVLALATVLSCAMPVRPWRGAVGIWTWMGLAALGAGIASTQSATGAADALRPAVVALAIVGPISVQRVTQHLATWPGSSQVVGQAVVMAALALQFLALLVHLPRVL